MLLRDEWKEWPTIKHVEKWGDLKLFECPLTVITSQTWEILRIVNSTVNSDGDIVLPYEGLTYVEQPAWYKQAVEVVRRERYEHRKQEMDKRGR